MEQFNIATASPAFDFNLIAQKREEMKIAAIKYLGEAEANLYFQYKEAITYHATPEMTSKVKEWEDKINNAKQDQEKEPKIAQFKALALELETIFKMKKAEIAGLVTGKEAAATPSIVIGVFKMADLGLKPTEADQKGEGMGKNEAGEVVFTWTMGKRYGGRGFANTVLQAIKGKGYEFAEKNFTPEMKAHIEEKAPVGKGRGTNKPMGFKNKQDFIKGFGVDIDLMTGEVKKAEPKAPAKKTAK